MLEALLQPLFKSSPFVANSEEQVNRENPNKSENEPLKTTFFVLVEWRGSPG